jgi:hypothetical protein
MQFTLTCCDEDGTITEKRFEGVYLDDVVSKTQDFLHGVGFVFEELEVQVCPVEMKEVALENDKEENPVFLSEEDAKRIASYYSQYRATD